MPTEVYNSNGIKAELSDIPSAPQVGTPYTKEEFAKVISKIHPTWSPEKCMDDAEYQFQHFLLGKRQERIELIVGTTIIVFLLGVACFFVIKSFTDIL
jgi:hypothetical protein